jgi:hypothetical protein
VQRPVGLALYGRLVPGELRECALLYMEAPLLEVWVTYRSRWGSKSLRKDRQYPYPRGRLRCAPCSSSLARSARSRGGSKGNRCWIPCSSVATTVLSIERNETEPQRRTIRKLASALGVEPSKLVERG